MAPKRKTLNQTKPMIIMALSLLVVFGGLFGWWGLRGYFIGKYMANFQPPPVTITASEAHTALYQPSIQAVGTLTAVNGVEVSNEVPGVVKAIHFASGHIVQEGSPLVSLDTRIEKADLKNYQAQLSLAKLSYDRLNKLFKQKLIAQSELDISLAKLEETKALVERTEAIIEQKNIKAPFTGKVGIKHIDVGGFIPAGTQIVTLQALNPLYVQFNLPEQNFPKLTTNQKLTLTPENGSNKTYQGEITAIDSFVEKNTRSILVQGTLDNKDLSLLPGMSTVVSVAADTPHKVITIPQTAIDYSLYGDSIFIVNEEQDKKSKEPVLKVRRQFIKVGHRAQDTATILEGLKEGDLIVTAGQLKLHNNTIVKIKKS